MARLSVAQDLVPSILQSVDCMLKRRVDFGLKRCVRTLLWNLRSFMQNTPLVVT